jgi:Domain of Unknown Function (DUF1080)
MTVAAILFIASSIAYAATPPWTPLFDGKTLAGWHVLGGESKFEVRDGVILGASTPNAQHTFLATDKTYGDFVLEYEFLVDPEMNSGVQIRSHTDPAYQGGKVFGLQVEIDSDLKTKRFWSGGIFDQTRRGWLADLTGNDAARYAFKPGEWNRTRVEAMGDSIKTWINGVPAADLVDSVDLDGFIALQVHQNKSATPMHVQFRNLRIQDYGRSRWKSAEALPAGDFAVRFGCKGACALRFGDLRLEQGEPQKGVKPLASGEWKRMSVSFHHGRLVVHSDGVRIYDLRGVAESRLDFGGSEVEALERLSRDGL